MGLLDWLFPKEEEEPKKLCRICLSCIVPFIGSTLPPIHPTLSVTAITQIMIMI